VAEHEELQWALGRRLEETRVALRSAGLQADIELMVGPPPATLLEAIGFHAPDLVVVGTRGLTGFQRLVLGSTAARLVRDSPAPVLTVHPGDAGRGERIRTVLVPTDFSDDALRAIEMAARLLGPARGASRLILCHAYHLPAEFSALGSAPIADGLERARDEAIRRLTELARGSRLRGARSSARREAVIRPTPSTRSRAAMAWTSWRWEAGASRERRGCSSGAPPSACCPMRRVRC
jgi:nucleotide-binding universal stress UspA family protein